MAERQVLCLQSLVDGAAAFIRGKESDKLWPGVEGGAIEVARLRFLGRGSFPAIAFFHSFHIQTLCLDLFGFLPFLPREKYFAKGRVYQASA